MAVEPKRGCGYRKVGGKYLVGGGVGVPCDRLPIELTVCPCCHGGIKQARSWTWIDVALLVGGVHQDCKDEYPCPLCMATSEMGKAGLLWIGEKFYPTWQDFDKEGQQLGLSRRIAAIPREFKVGETWVLLAHPKVIRHYVPAEPKDAATGLIPGLDEKITFTPGIFKVWRPTRIEQIFKESSRDSEEVADAIKRGITPVFVPDDDKDHQGRTSAEEEDDE